MLKLLTCCFHCCYNDHTITNNNDTYLLKHDGLAAKTNNKGKGKGNNNDRLKRKHNSFIRTFDLCLKRIIMSYFITENQCSNMSHDLENLLICCKSIKNIFRYEYDLRHSKHHTLIYHDRFNQRLQPNTMSG